MNVTWSEGKFTETYKSAILYDIFNTGEDIEGSDFTDNASMRWYYSEIIFEEKLQRSVFFYVEFQEKLLLLLLFLERGMGRGDTYEYYRNIWNI